ncbi:MAG TPA: nicotinate phosphoribosyltransferase [Mycobacteriales bacterium]|nr:nicotinate phosphoribosyltransferase [Mycobacteriales bacterium]
MTGPTGLCTDHYELTMVTAALRDGTADRHCVFEVFARRLPAGRRYGVVAGTGRLIDAVEHFRFDAEELAFLRERGVLDDRARDFLADFRFTGDILGYREGELYFPGSPVLTVRGRFAEAVALETLALSVLNHDTAVASAAARMVSAAQGRPIIEMGSRRTHEGSAVAAARAAYLAGFSSTSNLAAGHRYGIPTSGTAAHAFTMVHDSEAAAFRSQVEAFGPGTTLLVDTYDITQGIRSAVAEAGTGLGAIRIDSGDLGVLASQARELLDDLGATGTRIVLSGDLNEFSIATLAIAPVDAYGAGTSVVTGSGAPTAGMVYKLVEVDGRPVAKRSEHKISLGGEKVAVRRHKPTGTAIEERVSAVGPPEPMPGDLALQVPFLRAGERIDPPALADSREHLRRAMVTLPWDGLKLSQGEPAIPTRFTPES